MSSTRLEKLCNARKKACLFQRSEIRDDLEKLVASGDIFNWRDDRGLDALTHAAMGHRSGPCVDAFDYLFHQKVRPYSLQEKADGLEVIGSTYIFTGQHARGLNCLSEAFDYRSSPKSGLNEANLPPVTRRFAAPQWTNRSDVDRALTKIESLDGNFNAVYQALLIRLEFGLDFRMSEYFKVFKSLLSCPKRDDDTLNHAKLTVMLFEWYELYVSRSITSDDPSVYSWLNAVASSLLIETSRHQSLDNNGKLMRFENVKIVLKALATTFEQLRADLDARGTDIGHRYVDTDCATLSMISLLGLLCQMPLDDDQSLELKRCVNRIIAADWRDFVGNNLLLSTCKFLVPDDLGNDADIVRLLVDAGADVNCANSHGNTCLHLLVSATGELKNPSIAQLLLDNGARANVANKQGVTPLEALNNSIKNGTVNFHSSQCIEQQSEV